MILSCFLQIKQEWNTPYSTWHSVHYNLLFIWCSGLLLYCLVMVYCVIISSDILFELWLLIQTLVHTQSKKLKPLSICSYRPFSVYSVVPTVSLELSTMYWTCKCLLSPVICMCVDAPFNLCCVLLCEGNWACRRRDSQKPAWASCPIRGGDSCWQACLSHWGPSRHW